MPTYCCRKNMNIHCPINLDSSLFQKYPPKYPQCILTFPVLTVLHLHPYHIQIRFFEIPVKKKKQQQRYKITKISKKWKYNVKKSLG